METIIRRASIKDKDAIWNFIKVAYGDFSKHILPKRWNWQYRENPCVDKAEDDLPILLAIRGDQIVGQACVTEVVMKVGDNLHNATWGTDFIVLPICRGEGVGKKLMQIEVDHFTFMIGLWMPFVTRKIATHLGYKTLDPVNVYWRPGRLHKFFINYHLMMKAGYKGFSHQLVKICCRYFGFDWLISKLLNMIWRIRDLVERHTKKKNVSHIQEVDYFDEGIDILWQSTCNQFDIIVRRDKEFLNWRYSTDHQLTYRKFTAERNGETKGYVVLRRAEPEELNTGKIVDLYTRRDDHQTIEDLIRHAIHFFGNDVEVIEFAASGNVYKEAMSKFGFFKVETSFPMYRCEDSALIQTIESFKSNHFFTKGDHDWDQFTPVQ